MCAEANTEDSFDLQPDQNPIRLPPKQFLMVVQNQFFQQADSVTDVFVQSAFRANVEHIYSRPVTAADEAWAIIFNTVILLVLGSEVSAGGAEPLIGSQFARPFLVTLRTALSNPRVLMATKLINVQALALLSVAAQKYYPSGVAESIFAQACVLARSMGLHQAHATSDGVSAEETEERMKTFKSLYLRDKSFSISRGSICWLPSFDCGLSPALGQESFVEPNWNARLQLAKLQEEVYRHFHSAEPETQSPAKHRSTLKRIEQNLEKWADAHGIFSSSATGIRDVDIRLEFLAARICAFRDSLEESHRRQALIDSKASCLLLLISYGKHDSSMVEQLENLPLSKNQLKAPGRIAGPNGVAKERSGEQSPLLSHSLLDTFSNPAPFLLVRNFLESKAEDDPPDESDMNLLQRVCSCYKEVDGKTQANNHTRQFGSAIERLLEIVEVAKTPDLSQMPLDGADDNATLPSTFATQDLFNDAARAMPDFNDLPPSSSAFGMPSPIFWETFSSDSNKNSSAPSDTTSSGGPPTGFLTPLDSEFINVPHDPLQNSFPASFPSQPNGEVPSRKRPRYNSTAPTDQTMEFIAE
ncbi:MAG: hypothetical protein M1831_006860 [Alyxoria varia]|nr:MAG: hypothetical protein M1831_006860 [Alyxoria varia]